VGVILKLSRSILILVEVLARGKLVGVRERGEHLLGGYWLHVGSNLKEYRLVEVRLELCLTRVNLGTVRISRALFSLIGSSVANPILRETALVFLVRAARLAIDNFEQVIAKDFFFNFIGLFVLGFRGSGFLANRLRR
jgi:hypothetical protein